MAAGHRLGGVGKAALLMVAATLLLVLAVPARAAGMLTVTEVEPPAGGASGSPPRTGPRPTILGMTTEPGAPVYVRVLEGENPVLPILEATPDSEGAWSVSVPAGEPLENGKTYTAVAEQEEGATVSPPFTFEVSTAAPHVVLHEPPHRFGRTTPTFSGTAGEAHTKVAVRVLNESSEEVDHGETTVASAGAWSAPLEDPLSDGSYTVEATEESALGNPEGHSVAWPIEVFTEAPTIKLDAPPARTGTTKPTFSGTGTEQGTEVVVTVKRGSEELAKGKTTVGAGGKWSTGLSKALPTGDYKATVTAVETSGLPGNPAGAAGPDGFEVVTEAPTVTLHEPPERSNKQTPTFSGAGEEGGEVIVHVLMAGTNEEVDSGTVTVGAGGGWSTGLEHPLAAGKYSYSVFATEASAVPGDEATGKSATYVVEFDTEAPVVTLAKPPARTSEQKPLFSGTGSEEGGEVVVEVLEGTTVVGKGKTTVGAGDAWSATLEAPLPSGEHPYTVEAVETSLLTGNPQGRSKAWPMELDTNAPEVTLAEPAKRSNAKSPKFSGTGEAGGQVLVHVLRAGTSEEIGHGKATVAAGGSWSAGLEASLPAGEYGYTVYATEASLLGNGTGESVHFGVEFDSEAPQVTLDEPPKRSSQTAPRFEGAGEAGGQVTVHVIKSGTSEEIGHGKATVGSDGSWSAGLEAALHKGEYAYVVYATEVSTLSGNPKGESFHWTVELDTEGPSVTVTRPSSPSNQPSPTFGGTSSEEGAEVIVHVLKANTSEEIDTGRTTVGAKGGWSAGLEHPLAPGKYAYTVYATQVSQLPGNPKGESKPWTVEFDTEAPGVTLAKPPARTNEQSPTFSGTGSEEAGEVVVEVLEGKTVVGKGKTTVGAGEAWSATLEAPLPSGQHVYTVEAVETSLLTGNPQGRSKAWPMELDTNPPTVTLVEPVKRSNVVSPTFSGTGSEDGTQVVVTVKRGGSVLAIGKTTVSGGKWSTGLESELPGGEYVATVVAEESSGVGNGKGKTEADSFEIDTLAPKLSLEAPAKRTNSTSPVFSGTGEAGAPIVVRVKNGSEEVTGKTIVGGDGKWSTGLEKALPTGEYPASVSVKETSTLSGNPAAEAGPDGFAVDTEPPKVTIEPVKRSKNLNPTFSGTGSEAGTEVVLAVKRGGEVLAKGRTTVGTGGKWSTGLEQELPPGNYAATVVVEEASGLGNKPGTAETGLEIDSEAPKVTIQEPARRSNNLKPTFSGTGSEEGTEVVVTVKRGTETLAKGKTTVGAGGNWSAGLEAELPAGEYAASVVAEESSAVGNGKGKTEPASFEIDTLAPKLSLEAPAKRTNSTSPVFSGTGEAGAPIVVRVKNSGEEVTGKTTVGGDGKWSTGLETALPKGKYQATVSVKETSTLSGNPAAEAGPDGFEVDTEPPTVTVEPVKRSNNLKPTFSGTGSEAGTEVVVTVKRNGSEVLAKGTTTVSGGKWSTGLEKELPAGEYKATVVVEEASGLGNKSATVETPLEIDTEPPKVTVAAVPRSKNLKPTLSGTGSEEGAEVVVTVKRGTETLAKGKTTVGAGGSWSTGLEKELPAGNNYKATVVVEEASRLG
ncbi:MAG TPA: Ig-like domain-containing protein, partial [Solirubrobacteraceae bacterium]|nr:Ig-like domain-containing protein [Solirubrobacteraceae bacterium]